VQLIVEILLYVTNDEQSQRHATVKQKPQHEHSLQKTVHSKKDL